MSTHDTPNRALWSIAGPMLISNLSIPLLGVVDTAVLGHTDNPADLAAVALGSAIISTLFWAFGFLRMGTTGLAAQDYGRNGLLPELRLQQGLFIGFAVGALIIATHGLWLDFLSVTLAPTGLIREGVTSYTDIRIWGAIPALCLYAINGWFIGIGDAKTPLKLMVFVNSINIIGDLVFVTWLGFGAAGAAYATLIAEIITLMLALWLLRKRSVTLLSSSWQSLSTGLGHFVNANAALMGRTLILLGCILFFNAQGARFGSETAAANAVLYQLVALSAYLLDAYAHALESFTGRYIGRGDKTAFEQFHRVAIFWSLASAALFSLAFWLTGSQLINLMTNQEPTRLIANDYLIYVVCLPLASVLSYHFDGVFIGAGEFKAMAVVMAIAAACYFAVFYGFRDLGNQGLWLAFLALNGVRSAGMWCASFALGRLWFKHPTT